MNFNQLITAARHLLNGPHADGYKVAYWEETLSDGDIAEDDALWLFNEYGINAGNPPGEWMADEFVNGDYICTVAHLDEFLNDPIASQHRVRRELAQAYLSHVWDDLFTVMAVEIEAERQDAVEAYA